MSTPQGRAPAFYTKDQLMVTVELIEAIDIRFLPILQAIFNTEEWLWQSQPIPRQMIRGLCLKDPLTDRFICVFCPDCTFNQSGHAIEHLQQHFGLRPFLCIAPEWYGPWSSSGTTATESLLVRKPSCVRMSSRITPAPTAFLAMFRVPMTGGSHNAPMFHSLTNII